MRPLAGLGGIMGPAAGRVVALPAALDPPARSSRQAEIDTMRGLLAP